jgi:hypothetical protein
LYFFLHCFLPIDRRYGALKTLKARKEAFAVHCVGLKAQSGVDKQRRQVELRSLLKMTPAVTADSRVRDAAAALGHTYVWKAFDSAGEVRERDTVVMSHVSTLVMQARAAEAAGSAAFNAFLDECAQRTKSAAAAAALGVSSSMPPPVVLVDDNVVWTDLSNALRDR